MKVLDLKVSSGRDEDGAALLERFFARLGDQDPARASRLADAGFRWFGQAVDAARWRSEAFATYLRAEPMRHEAVRAVPPDLVGRLTGTPEDLYDGPLEADEAVYLVDVVRGTRKVTCGVVVGSSPKARVRRVFDPAALAAALAAFSTEGEG